MKNPLFCNKKSLENKAFFSIFLFRHFAAAAIFGIFLSAHLHKFHFGVAQCCQIAAVYTALIDINGIIDDLRFFHHCMAIDHRNETLFYHYLDDGRSGHHILH